MISDRKQVDISYSNISLLNKIGQEFSSSLNFESVIDTIMSRVKEVLKCKASSVILYDKIKDSLLFYAASGAGSRKVKGLTMPKGKGFAGWVFEHKKPVIVADVESDERFYGNIDKITHIRTKSLICVPIVKKDRIIGVIEGINKTEGAFTKSDLDLLTAISQLAGISIENSMIHKNLEEKNDMLARINREMEEFVNIVSHDLQTPLASIEGYAGLIKKEMVHLLKSNSDLATYVTRINENCKNMFHFIRRLLSLLKLNDSSISVQEFDPVSVLDDILIVLEEEIQNKHAKILYNSPLNKIRYDRSIFYHILLNLIQNSLNYSSSDRKPLIEINSEGMAGEIQFMVRDNGTGISKEDMDIIFNFYKRGNALKLTNGYGVGLAFVKKAVEMFGGIVWVETEPNKGSTFYFSIPR
jgi:K+-sensing histidine kinase KdpD